MEHAHGLGPLEEIERRGLGARVVALLLPLAPPAPPGAGPGEGRVLQREPRQRVERLARVRAEEVVQADLRPARRRQLEHGDLRAAPLELLAEGEHRLQQVRARPDIGVRDDHRLPLHPVDAVEIGDRPAGGLPVPEPADRDAGEAVLIRPERLLLPLGDQERHRGIGQRRAGRRRHVQARGRSRALVVADRVALAVIDRREQLAADELVVAPHRDVAGRPVVREDEHVTHLADEPGAQEPREVGRRRRVEARGGDGRVVEPRSPEILEGLGMERERVHGLLGTGSGCGCARYPRGSNPRGGTRAAWTASPSTRQTP